MADQIAARSIRASLAQTCLARIVQHRQGTGPDLCARYRLHRLVLLLADFFEMFGQLSQSLATFA